MQGPRTRTSLRWLEIAALSLGSLVAVFVRFGTSPWLWQDTLNDERLLRLCLEHGHCSLAGAPVSFGHFWQGATWHQLRAFLEWLGAGVTGSHAVWLVFDAAAVVIVALVATRIAGRLAGLFAAVSFLLLIDSADPVSQMLWNFRPLPFGGALVLGLSVMVVERGKVLVAVLAAAAAAVVANVHMVSGVILLGLVLACLLVPKRRLRLALAATGTFAVLVLLTSPAAWWHNLDVLLRVEMGPGGGPGGGQLLMKPLATWGLVISAAILVLVRWFPVARRRPSLVVPAFVLPMVTGFLVIQAVASINRTDRYLITIAPAVAVGLGIVGGWLAARLELRGIPKLRRVLGAGIPYLTAGLLCLVPAPRIGWAGVPLPTFEEVTDVLGELRDRLGWDQATAFANLKGPHDYLMLEAMQVTGFHMGSGSPRSADLKAIVFKLRARDLPSGLPGNFHRLPADGEHVLLVVVVPSWLSWSSFEVCDDRDSPPAGAGCRATGLTCPEVVSLKPAFATDHMPDAGRAPRQDLVLRVPVRMPPGPRRHELHMPRLNDTCAGRILSVPPGASSISADGRSAELVADGDGYSESWVTMAWALGSPDCPTQNYRGFPPFFLEADPQSMRVMIETLSGYEAREAPP